MQLQSETKSSLKACPDLDDARYGLFSLGKNTYTGLKSGEGTCLKGAYVRELTVICVMCGKPISKLEQGTDLELNLGYSSQVYVFVEWPKSSLC